MSEQDEGVLERHQPAYAEWLAANPQGFVLLARTNTIHRATAKMRAHLAEERARHTNAHRP